jgi:UPF0716 protein FxsA
MWILLLAFVGIPLAEIALFIEVGGRIGLWPTLATVIATAIIGSALLRLQGLNALRQLQGSLERGEMPVEHIFTGACLLVAGAFLLTPGFLTDTIGFMLFVPIIRSFIGRMALGKLAKRGAQARQQNRAGNKFGTIVEGEFDEIFPEDSVGNKAGRIGRRPDKTGCQ